MPHGVLRTASLQLPSYSSTAHLSSSSAQFHRRPDPSSFPRGPAIIKHWRGAQHAVMVGNERFQHQGKVYRSLSQLAREITGTRWNGPAFFGLRKGHGRTEEVRKGGK